MAYVHDSELQTQLENMADEIGISMDELLTAISKRFSACELDIEGLKLDIKKITEVGELDQESMMEKIIAINEAMGNASDDVVETLFDRIADNKKAHEVNSKDIAANAASIKDLQGTVEAGQAADSKAREALAETVANNKTAQGLVNSDIEQRVSANEKAIDTLNSDADTAGSVANAVAQEAARAKAQEALNAKGVAANAAAIDALKGDGDGSLGSLEKRVKVVEDTLNDTNDEDGNLVKGHSTRIKDLETNAAQVNDKQAKTNADFEARITTLATPSTGVVCGRKAGNKFRLRVGQAEKSFDCGTSNSDGETM